MINNISALRKKLKKSFAADPTLAILLPGLEFELELAFFFIHLDLPTFHELSWVGRSNALFLSPDSP